jgi:hypothetical protein
MKFLKPFSICILVIVSLASCKKSGCTDIDASNFDSEASTDDGTCAYTGNIVFWCLPAVSDSLRNLGHTKLYFELESEIVDSISTEFFFSPAGDCNGSGTKTFSREFSGDSKWNYHYRVKGLNQATIYEDFILLKANECLDVRLL